MGVGIVGFAACSPAKGNSDDQPPVDSNDGFKVVNVEVETVEPTTFTDFIRITGEVEAYSDVTISAEESGAITEFLVSRGDHVRRGQIIARISSEGSDGPGERSASFCGACPGAVRAAAAPVGGRANRE